MSIKSLAIKVLQRNFEGNRTETQSFHDRKLEKPHFPCEGNHVFSLDKNLPKPYLETDGGLVIPFGSDSRYHWWAGGQKVKDTIEELKGAFNA